MALNNDDLFSHSSGTKIELKMLAGLQAASKAIGESPLLALLASGGSPYSLSL